MITGGTITKVSGEHVKNQPHESMEVNIRIGIVRFDKSKLTVSYTYEVNYKPDVAKLTIDGELYFEDSEKEMKAVKEHWDSKGQFPEKVASDMLTAMTYTCSAVGTLLAFAVNVNAPINVPRARLAPQEAKPAA